MNKTILITVIAIITVALGGYLILRANCEKFIDFHPATESNSDWGGKTGEYYSFSRYMKKEKAIEVLQSKGAHPEWGEEDYESLYEVLKTGNYPALDGEIKDTRKFKTKKDAVGYCVSSKI